MGTILKSNYMHFLLLLVLPFVVFPQGNQSTEFQITNINSSNPINITLSPEGNLSATVQKCEECLEPIPDGSFLFEKQSDTKAAVTEDLLSIKEKLIEDNLSEACQDDFVVSNNVVVSNPEQLIVTTEGDVRLPGSSRTQEEAFESVGYVDNHVLEKLGTDDSYQYKYTTVATEGKSLASDEFQFFLKDHLGSTRRVLSEDMTDVEVLAYQAYGTQKTVTSSSGDKNRDNFTGKELDKEGKIASLEVNITITNFSTIVDDNAIITLHYENSVTEDFIIESKIVVNNNITYQAYLPLLENHIIEEIRLTINDVVPDINNLELPFDPTLPPGETTYELGEKMYFSIDGDISGGTVQFSSSDFYKKSEGYIGMVLNYFGARYYDPDIGLWVSTDPAMEFFTPYRYTTNPIAFLDPNGLDDFYFTLYKGKGYLSYRDDNQKVLWTVPANSGREKWLNNPKGQNKRDYGPTPEGNYSININKDAWPDKSVSEGDPVGWGLAAYRLNPQKEPSLLKRALARIGLARSGGYYLHQDMYADNPEGTMGCIGVLGDKNISKVVETLYNYKQQGNNSIDVIVNYNNDNDND